MIEEANKKVHNNSLLDESEAEADDDNDNDDDDKSKKKFLLLANNNNGNHLLTTNNKNKLSDSSAANNIIIKKWETATILDNATVIKLAGEEAKDRLYEPKHKKKIVRVLTVIAYVFFVSLAAIMLSLYYIFLWNGQLQQTHQQSINSLKSSHNKWCSGSERLLRQDYMLSKHYFNNNELLKEFELHHHDDFPDEKDFAKLEKLRNESVFFRKLFNEFQKKLIEN